MTNLFDYKKHWMHNLKVTVRSLEEFLDECMKTATKNLQAYDYLIIVSHILIFK
ncbi:hypothetical protein JCM9140_3154 [Halalkalibacter wakoensis JCM 9140]|uniref:Uncharacterized protein n=1 Tax=Halalkalibacter wakoensis JCM 9140 TaxID=1236970 RepID=W4Q4X3_9BACI|nr:hypothetical protein JCM9140_3154 [Halalkalibacter wakoensis JCM 9140]